MTSKEALTKLLECDEQLKVLEMFKCMCEMEMAKSAKKAAKLKKRAVEIVGSMTIGTRDLMRDWLRATLEKRNS